MGVYPVIGNDKKIQRTSTVTKEIRFMCKILKMGADHSCYRDLQYLKGLSYKSKKFPILRRLWDTIPELGVVDIK